MSYRIERGEKPASEVRRIVREQLERALCESAALGGVGEIKAVHGIRKRIKKIRAVLRLVKKEVGAELFHEENRRLRSASCSFSGVRDANVQLQVLEKVRDSAGLEAGAFAGVISYLMREREDATERHKTQQHEAVALLESLQDRLDGWLLDPVGLETLCCALGRTYRKGRDCLRHALDHQTAENFHSWRKHTKNVWYQARMLQELNPEVICEISEAANRLGGHFGDLHDLAFLRESLASAGVVTVSEKEVLLGLICAREKALEQTAVDLGCRFYAEKPGAFGRCLLRYAGDSPSTRQA